MQFVGIFFFFLSLPATAPLRANTSYIHRQWSTRDGLPQNTINCMVQDFNGFLWLGTDNGLVRFDGDDFLVFNRTNTKALKSNRITALTIGAGGKLWIGTYGGGLTTYVYRDTRFYAVPLGQNTKRVFITAIAEGPDKSIWMGTMSFGLIRFRKGASQVFNADNGLLDNTVRALTFDSKNRLWIGTTNGLNLFDKEITVVSRTTGLPGNNIRHLYLDAIGTLWVACDSGLCWKFESEEHFNTITHRSVADKTIMSILRDKVGVIRVGTDDGLAVFEETEHGYRALGLDKRFDKKTLTALLEDRSGILWLGTRADGLHRLKEALFSSYNTGDGLSHHKVNSLFKDDMGTLWIGTGGGGLNKMKGGKVSVFTKKNGLNSNYINAVTGGNGTIWAGTPQGLNRLKNNTFTSYGQKDGLSKNEVSALLYDPQRNQSSRGRSGTPSHGEGIPSHGGGTLWIGTHGGGLMGFRNGEFFIPGTGLELKNAFVLSMAKDVLGFLWIGTTRGLYCLKDNRFKVPDDGNRLSKYVIQAIHADAGGTLWLGTAANGLIYFSGKRIVEYYTDPTFSGASIFSILEDNKKNLWLASANGMYTISRYSVSHFNNSSRNPAKFSYFNKGRGLSLPVFSRGTGCRDDSRLWFPAADGIVSFDPSNIPMEYPEFPVLIDNIAVDGKSVKLTDKMYFKGINKLEIHFTTINLKGLDNLEFKCVLTNRLHNRGDMDARMVKEKYIRYTDLGNGDYFCRIVSNIAGRSLGEQAFTFTVRNAGSIWEVLIFILVALLPIGIVIASKIMHRRAKARELPKIFKDDVRYKTSAMKSRDSRKLLKELVLLMEEERPYLDANLSVAVLAKKLNTSKEHISQAVNKHLYMNFNHFLNKYRVEEAKAKLLDPKESQFVLLKIAHDVGFNSKSTFNAAFKKITGMSPTQYREQKRKEDEG